MTQLLINPTQEQKANIDTSPTIKLEMLTSRDLVNNWPKFASNKYLKINFIVSAGEFPYL